MDYTLAPTVASLSDAVSIIEIDQVKAVRIDHPLASAVISLHGAHLLSFIPAGSQDLIWISEQALFDGKAAIRGGVPVCWPWFGRVAAPAHGFARTSTWELNQHRENDQGVIVELGLTDSAETHSVWPHKFNATLRIEVSQSLTLTLDVENSDTQPWQFSGALHTYLNLGDIAQATTTGMGPTYLDSLQQGIECNGDSSLTLSDTIDRVYNAPEKVITVNDPVFERTINVINQGHNSAVLWNPWAEGAKAMGDMQDDGYKTMLCVESTWHAASLEQGKTLQPGERHQLVTTVTL